MLRVLMQHPSYLLGQIRLYLLLTAQVLLVLLLLFLESESKKKFLDRSYSPNNCLNLPVILDFRLQEDI